MMRDDASGTSDVTEARLMDGAVLNSSQSNAAWESRRLDGVQGLRTVAALLVAVYHIWFDRVSGGVDVFFVVAGFFCARALARMIRATSIADLFHQLGIYWARTARRVVPSAALVILATVTLSIWRMPVTMWQENVHHGFASLLFFENWHLIATGSEYNQASASPFQQFWALSLQVQSYIVLPILVIVAILVAKLLEQRPRMLVTGVLVVAFAASFSYSVYFTSANQQAAYFSLATRLWEFTAGVIFFFLMQKWRGGSRLARPLGFLGLLIILFSGALLDLSVVLPGYHSLILIAGAAAVMFSSIHGSEPKILTAKPMLALADASFAFYV